MPLLQFDQLSLSLGPRTLLEQVELNVEPKERIALVGANGAGKSTLMKLVTGELAPDSGAVWIAPHTRVAVLEQALPDADERTVKEVVRSGLSEVSEMLSRFEHLMASESESKLEEIEQLQQRIEAVDGWSLEQRVTRVLSDLELPGETLMAELSGGWRRRAALGAALVQAPDLLLLDEPTNHLDIETILWLEQVMLQFKGAVLFVSHDRALVEHLATRIVELDRGELRSYPGRYTEYLEKRAKRLEEEERQNAQFDKKLAEEERWIRQGIKARRTRNEGRVRALKKLRNERAERCELQGRARFEYEDAERSGKLVSELKRVSVQFDEQRVIDSFSALIQRGDRIGLIGPNGAGKSTLLSLILGRLSPTEGSVRLGTQLKVAYFDQLRAQLDPEKTIIDNVSGGRESIAINGRDRHIIGYLQDFLFTPERSRTPVKALSGGETNRVMLAKLFSQPSNLLVLDEPTNDLDVETLELLEEILSEYQGTLLLVSHDRQFLDNIVTSTFVFEGQGRIQEYVGGYQDWLRQRSEQPVTAKCPETKSPEKSAEKIAEKPRAQTKLSYKLQRELDQLPERIAEAEEQLAAQQALCSSPDFYSQDHQQVSDSLAQLHGLEEELNQLMERWIELEALQESP